VMSKLHLDIAASTHPVETRAPFSLDTIAYEIEKRVECYE
jgi:hypothetical protein